MEEDIIEKGIKASFDFTADEIRSYALKIKARELGFLPDDSELVDLREIAKSKEMKLYRKYFTDNTHQKLAKTGIWLRKNEGKDAPLPRQSSERFQYQAGTHRQV